MASLTDNMLNNAWSGQHLNGISNEDNCSGFIHSLLKSAGISIPSGLNANGMVDHFDISPAFTSIGTGNTALKQAYDYATSVKLVIVGVKGSEIGQHNGHVAIVLGKGGSDNPLVYGGSLGGIAKSKGNKHLSQIFKRADFDKLHYFLAP